jgi:hypothetical protein
MKAFAVLVVTIVLGASAPLKAQFRAAVVKEDITPDTPQVLLGYSPRTSTGVHDPIMHRIVALDDGKTQFFLVSSDICEVSPSLVDRVAVVLYSKYGIRRENFWWTVTHTHSAPEVGSPGLDAVFLGERFQHKIDSAYAAFVVEKLILGIGAARKALAPARIGVGWGFSQANINRRGIDVNGKASLGLNPDGPVDRRIGLIRLEDQDGKLMGLIANYAIHGTVLGPQSTEISGDVPGIVSQYVEEKTGAPMLFVNGAAGDLAPIYSVYASPSAGHLSQFRVLLGNRILNASKAITEMSDKVTLTTGSLMVETPRKQGLAWAADLEGYTRATSSGVNLIRLPVRFLKINDDIAIWSAPLELFCEISNEIRNRSPFPFTFYFGYANGWLGYLPSAAEFPREGYEVNDASPYTPQAEEDLKEAVTGYLEGELKSLK